MMARSRCASALLCLGLLGGELLAADPFVVTTPGKAGLGGVVPELSGQGSGQPGTQQQLLLRRAAKDSTATLVLGLSEWALPFKGGVLGPALDVLLPGLPIDAAGRLVVPFVVPGDVPPDVDVWLQCWIVDPAASFGLSASNSLKFRTQAANAALYDVDDVLVTDIASGPAGVATGDFDEDGVLDVVVHAAGPDELQLLLGLGDGSLATPPASALPDASGAFATADLDADGHLDLAFLSGPGDLVGVRLGHGDGSFGAFDGFATGHLPVDLVAADADGDGVVDVVTADAAGSVSVLLGRGGGDLDPAVSLTVGFNPTHVAVGDADGDGLPDLAVTYGGANGRVALLIGQGAASFAEPLVLSVGALPEDLLIVDLDGDAIADLAVVHTASDDVVVLPGLGAGAFGPGVSYPLPPGTQPRTLACADLDQDGQLDLVASRFEGLSVLRGAGDGGLCRRRPTPCRASCTTAWPSPTSMTTAWTT